MRRLLHNLAGVRRLVEPARVMPVIKANAYGAGALGVWPSPCGTPAWIAFRGGNRG